MTTVGKCFGVVSSDADSPPANSISNAQIVVASFMVSLTMERNSIE